MIQEKTSSARPPGGLIHSQLAPSGASQGRGDGARPSAVRRHRPSHRPGGLEMIAMLRSSPVVPFSLGDDPLGLTAVCFWPGVLSSWLAPELASLQLPIDDLTTPMEGGSPWPEKKFHSGS